MLAQGLNALPVVALQRRPDDDGGFLAGNRVGIPGRGAKCGIHVCLHFGLGRHWACRHPVFWASRSSPFLHSFHCVSKCASFPACRPSVGEP